METLVKLAQGFIKLFQTGGENLMGMVTGIIPTLAVLLITINALIAFIGEDRVERFAVRGTRFAIVRYVVLPVVGGFTMPNPGGLTLGRFLKEDQKSAFGDASSTLGHPMTSLFPHTNPGELFVWLGIAQGIEQLGLPTTELAIRYIAAGMILALIRGLSTERVYKIMERRKKKEKTQWNF